MSKFVLIAANEHVRIDQIIKIRFEKQVEHEIMDIETGETTKSMSTPLAIITVNGLDEVRTLGPEYMGGVYDALGLARPVIHTPYTDKLTAFEKQRLEIAEMQRRKELEG